MAKGRSWRNRLLMLLAASTFTLLVVVDIVPNPLPPLWEWINRDRPIVEEKAWQERLGSRPSAAEVAGDTVAMDAGRRAQVRDRDSGDLMVGNWTADWLTVAGTGDRAVAITGEMFSRGYEVRDPTEGAVVAEDEDARAVWGFREARLDLRCDGPRSCELRRYPPDAAEPVWTTALPGAGSGLTGADPELATARVAVPDRVHRRAAGPAPLPPLLGVPVDRRLVAVVHSGTGELVAELEVDGDEKVMVIGDRVVRSVATRRDGLCTLAVTAYDAASGTPVWGPRPYNLRTVTDGGGCEQDDTPVAAGAALVAVEPDGTELIVDAGDGRVLWRGDPDEYVRGLTESLAVVQGADPTRWYAVRLGTDGAPVWEQSADDEAQVLVGACGVMVADQDPDRLHVWDLQAGGERLSVRTSARLLACARDGVMLASGRSVAFVPFAGAGTETGAPGGPQ